MGVLGKISTRKKRNKKKSKTPSRTYHNISHGIGLSRKDTVPGTRNGTLGIKEGTTMFGGTATASIKTQFDFATDNIHHLLVPRFLVVTARRRGFANAYHAVSHQNAHDQQESREACGKKNW